MSKKQTIYEVNISFQLKLRGNEILDKQLARQSLATIKELISSGSCLDSIEFDANCDEYNTDIIPTKIKTSIKKI